MKKYHLVPLEGQMFLLRAEQSKPLDAEEEEKIFSAIRQGVPEKDLEDLLDDIWFE